MPSQSMPALVMEAVAGPITDLGFRRRGKTRVFTIELGGDFAGFLGLQMASQHYQGKAVDVFPTVGVRNQEVERVVADLRGDHRSEYVPPTVSGPLYVLVPEASGMGWRVERDSIENDVRPLVEAIATAGVPAVSAIADLKALEAKIDEGWGIKPQLVYRLPVVRALRGDASGARQALEQALVALGSRTDAAAQELRAFEAPFEEWLRLRM